MKNKFHIVPFLLFAAMIFSLVQYMPVSEEECANKIELSKKPNETKSGSEKSEKEDGDSENDEFLNADFTLLPCHSILASHTFITSDHSYSFFIPGKTSPPPEA